MYQSCVPTTDDVLFCADVEQVLVHIAVITLASGVISSFWIEATGHSFTEVVNLDILSAIAFKRQDILDLKIVRILW
jgi:hypothetical protein